MVKIGNLLDLAAPKNLTDPRSEVLGANRGDVRFGPKETSRTIAIRQIANLCLSFDHRALDGAEAARFLGRLKELLEGPETSAL